MSWLKGENDDIVTTTHKSRPNDQILEKKLQA